MFEFIVLIIGRKYWKLHSLIVKFILKLYGIQVGRGFYCEGVPKLKIMGKGSNISFGDYVSILGNIDLRNREDGVIDLKKHVTVEGNVRIVSARHGKIEVGEGSIITAFALINGGEDIIIGKRVIVGPRVSINSNEHVFKRDQAVREAGFDHAPVYIEDDCWIAANVVINKGVRLRKGSIIGAGAIVTKDTEEYSINVGIPSKKIAERT